MSAGTGHWESQDRAWDVPYQGVPNTASNTQGSSPSPSEGGETEARGGQAAGPLAVFPAARGHFPPCPCWEQGLDTSHRWQLVGMEAGQEQEGCGSCPSPRWRAMAQPGRAGPTQTLPCGKRDLDAVCHLGEVAAVWLVPVQAQMGLSPAQSPAELWGSRKAATELIYTWFTPCCCPDPLAQSSAVSRRVALPTCRHSPAHCSAGLPLITLRAEGLTAAILFPVTLQMIQHNKTYNSPLEKRKL